LVGPSVKDNFDILNLCKKSISDMRGAQTGEGLIPEIAPEFVVFNNPFRDSPEWGSACILLPWYVYQWYGDERVLADNYAMMKKYLAYLQSKTNNYILSHGLGDWFDIGPKKSGFSQMTPMGLTATATYYYDLSVMAQIAGIVGEKEDIAAFQSLALKVKQAFNDKFFNKQTKQYGTGSQASNAVPLYMGLVDNENKKAVVDNVVEELEKNNYRLTAGDIGFRYLIQALYEAGRSDVIYKMNNRDDVPGYGYQLKHGATALTESWQAYPSVSNNHFMLGDLMEWFYSALAGISQTPNSVAFSEVKIKPEVVGGITFAKGSYQSPYGTIATQWQTTKHSFEINITIPPNAKALIYLPALPGDGVKENGKTWTGKIEYAQGCAVIKTGSGKYHFSVLNKK
jgi:Glycogen debranching enzyme